MAKEQIRRVPPHEQQQQAGQIRDDECAITSQRPISKIVLPKHGRKLSQRQRKAIRGAEKERIVTEVCEQHVLQEEESKIMIAPPESSMAHPEPRKSSVVISSNVAENLRMKAPTEPVVRHVQQLEVQKSHVTPPQRQNLNREPRNYRGSEVSLNWDRPVSELPTSPVSNGVADPSRSSLCDALSTSNASPEASARQSAVNECLRIMELLEIISDYVYDNGSSRLAFASSLNFMLVCKRFMLVMFRKLASIRFFDTFYSVDRNRFDHHYAYCLRHLRFRDSYLAKYDDEANATKYLDQNMIIYSRYSLVRFRKASFPKLKTLEICEAGSLGLVLAAPLAPSLEEIITRSPVLLSDGCILQISEFYPNLRRIEIANPGIPLQPHEADTNLGFTDDAFAHLLSLVRFTLEELVLYCPKAADANQRTLERRIMAPRLYPLSLAVLSSMPRLTLLEAFAISEKKYSRDLNNFREGMPLFHESFNLVRTLGLPEIVAGEDYSGAVYAHRYHSRPETGTSASIAASAMSLLLTRGEIIASRRSPTWSSTTSSQLSLSVSRLSLTTSDAQSNHASDSVDTRIATPVSGFCPFEKVVYRREFFASLGSLKMVSHTAEFVFDFLCMFPGRCNCLMRNDTRASNLENEEEGEEARTALRHLEITFMIGSELERFLIRAYCLSWSDMDASQSERMHVLRGLESLKLNVIGECALKSKASPQVYVARESIDMFEMAYPQVTLQLTSRVKIIDESSDMYD
ncbi:hypothetical protein V1509DRAFT_627581 [Lipomyces kononenkoae]